jgi:hypothetical protein
MVTKEQALTATYFHYTGKHACSKHVGPRGGVTIKVTEVRRNGQTQVWKRDADKFRVPVKYGLREYSEITEQNAGDWHVAGDCEVTR